MVNRKIFVFSLCFHLKIWRPCKHKNSWQTKSSLNELADLKKKLFLFSFLDTCICATCTFNFNLLEWFHNSAFLLSIANDTHFTFLFQCIYLKQKLQFWFWLNSNKKSWKCAFIYSIVECMNFFYLHRNCFPHYQRNIERIFFSKIKSWGIKYFFHIQFNYY